MTRDDTRAAAFVFVRGGESAVCDGQGGTLPSAMTGLHFFQWQNAAAKANETNPVKHSEAVGAQNRSISLNPI